MKKLFYSFIQSYFDLFYFLPTYYREYNTHQSVLTECPKLPLSILHGYINGTDSVPGSEYSFSRSHGYLLFGEQSLKCAACLKGISNYLAILSAPILFVLNYSNRVFLFFTTVSRRPDLA